MTGIDGGVVGQAEEAFLDALAERLVAATGEVGAANAATEERVSGENPTFDFGIEADAPLGVAWGADNFQGAFPYLDDFFVLQVAVGQVEGAVGRKAEPRGLLSGVGVVALRLRMRRNGDTVTPFDCSIADDMVDVAVSADHHHRFQLMAVDEAKEFVLLAWA